MSLRGESAFELGSRPPGCTRLRSGRSHTLRSKPRTTPIRAGATGRDAFSVEKRQHMEALGAGLTLVPSESGGMDASLGVSAALRMRDLDVHIVAVRGSFVRGHLDGRQRAGRDRSGKGVRDREHGGHAGV